MVRKSSLFLIFSFLLLLSGCAVEPRYDVRVFQPNKDVVLVLIYVPARLDVSLYRQIAANEVKRLLASRAPDEPPLYEARFEFLTLSKETGEAEKVASSSWNLEAPDRETSARRAEPLILIY